ncbi:AhpD-like protein [Syncephalis fuscata]|nr:AhpD-like protein [Syncephalis fuscata]
MSLFFNSFRRHSLNYVYLARVRNMETFKAVTPYTSQDLKTWEELSKPFPQPFATAVTVAVLAAANQSEQIEFIVHRALQSQPDIPAKARMVETIREALMKALPLCGVPRTIDAMNACVNTVDPEVLDTLPTTPHRVATDFSQIKAWRERGQQFFDRIYVQHSQKVVNKLNHAYPDLIEVILQDMYGKILSDTRLLDERETELVAIGVLHTMQMPKQLHSHVKGAQNIGVTEHQVNSLLALAQAITAPIWKH